MFSTTFITSFWEQWLLFVWAKKQRWGQGWTIHYQFHKRTSIIILTHYKWLYERHKLRHVLHKQNKARTHIRNEEPVKITAWHLKPPVLKSRKWQEMSMGAWVFPLSLSDSMIKACWSPERLCRSVFLATELSCSKDPKRSNMIKAHFHTQKPSPTSRTTLPLRSQCFKKLQTCCCDFP